MAGIKYISDMLNMAAEITVLKLMRGSKADQYQISGTENVENLRNAQNKAHDDGQ